jgi:hypothetical protein
MKSNCVERTASFGYRSSAFKHVVDTVGTERNAYTGQAGHTEDAREVVVAATTGDTPHRRIQGLHLEDGAGVIVQAAGQRQVELNLIVQAPSASAC